jgi:predicted Zn-dependent protease
MDKQVISHGLDKIFNRHLARTMSNMQEINTPAMVCDGVKSNMLWLIKDIKEYLREV